MSLNARMRARVHRLQQCVCRALRAGFAVRSWVRVRVVWRAYGVVRERVWVGVRGPGVGVIINLQATRPTSERWHLRNGVERLAAALLPVG